MLRSRFSDRMHRRGLEDKLLSGAKTSGLASNGQLLRPSYAPAELGFRRCASVPPPPKPHQVASSSLGRRLPPPYLPATSFASGLIAQA